MPSVVTNATASVDVARSVETFAIRCVCRKMVAQPLAAAGDRNGWFADIRTRFLREVSDFSADACPAVRKILIYEIRRARVRSYNRASGKRA